MASRRRSYFATDIAVVNKDLEVISPSYWKWKRLKAKHDGQVKPKSYMRADSRYGIRDESGASGFGESGCREGHQPRLVGAAHCGGDGQSHLRSHSDRAVSCPRLEISPLPKEVGLVPYLKLGLDASFLRRGLGRRIEQANALADAMTGRMPPDKLKIIRRFTRLQSQGFVQRRWTLVSGNYLYHDLVRSVATFALM